MRTTLGINAHSRLGIEFTVGKYVRTVDMLRPARFRQPEGFTDLAVERCQHKADVHASYAGSAIRELSVVGCVRNLIGSERKRRKEEADERKEWRSTKQTGSQL